MGASGRLRTEISKARQWGSASISAAHGFEVDVVTPERGGAADGSGVDVEGKGGVLQGEAFSEAPKRRETTRSKQSHGVVLSCLCGHRIPLNEPKRLGIHVSYSPLSHGGKKAM
jgi:hypothetical protein